MTRTLTTAGIAAAGLLAIVATATPALAYQNGSGTCTGTGPTATGTGPAASSGFGPGMGAGMGRGQGMGAGMGQASRVGANQYTSLPSGTLTTAQETALIGMADEEKLAHDLYVALAARYPALTQFARIAQSETQHLTTMRLMLDRYDLADPTAGLPAGDFASDAFDALYDSLLAGATTSTAALAAGVAVEKADIADLDAARAGLDAPDLAQAYANLRAASEHHLTAFSR